MDAGLGCCGGVSCGHIGIIEGVASVDLLLTLLLLLNLLLILLLA